jgi:hypothetical protein
MLQVKLSLPREIGAQIVELVVQQKTNAGASGGQGMAKSGTLGKVSGRWQLFWAAEASKQGRFFWKEQIFHHTQVAPRAKNLRLHSCRVHQLRSFGAQTTRTSA